MEKSKTSIGKVMFSCTKNIVLAVIIFYLICLFFSFIDDHWSTISQAMISFFLIFKPIKIFMLEHLGKIFLGWLVICSWSVCVAMKLDKHKIPYPKFLDGILFSLFPSACLILFMAAIHPSTGFLGLFLGVCGVLLTLFTIMIILSFFFEDLFEVEKDKNLPKGKQAPQQLDLFDK